MERYFCTECEKVADKPDSVAVWTEWVRCDCGAQMRRRKFARDAVAEVVNPWMKGGRMHVSEAMGVHPRQTADLAAADKERGAKCEGYKHGCPVFSSRGQKAQYAKARGFFEKNSYS